MPPGGWIFSYILLKVVTESTFNVFELEWKRIERMYIHLQPINPQMDVFGLWEVHYRFMTLISNWTASKLTLNQCADLFTNLLWRGMHSYTKWADILPTNTKYKTEILKTECILILHPRWCFRPPLWRHQLQCLFRALAPLKVRAEIPPLAPLLVLVQVPGSQPPTPPGENQKH